jgi:saccharopine dehydrogenase-like NADP-dependent oxidoreductase
LLQLRLKLMKSILILGGGKSCTVLIEYLSHHAATDGYHIVIADADADNVREKVGLLAAVAVVEFTLEDTLKLENLVREATIVVSMLPAHLHIPVAHECLKQRRNMVTASYVSPEMEVLHQAAQERGLLFLNEMGVDPGIDHMSAMRVVERIKAEGGIMTGFESFTGGLIAPECERDNPWRYKFTWNPRNVVLAGQGAAKFVQMGKYKYIPYHRLFRRTEIINIPSWGTFEGYGNRDSLKYRSSYGLQDIPTMYRGTLRRPGFCRTWDAFVLLGATDDSYIMEGSENMTKRDFINSFMSYNPHDSVELKLAHYLHLDLDSEEMYKLKWLGIFDNVPVGLKKPSTPAQMLQKILEDKWSLQPDDKDMLVMWHRFNFTLHGEQKEIHASMVSIGEDGLHTAMAKTVGLPVAIAVRKILKGEIALTGVHIPTLAAIYDPVLDELETQGIVFEEREVEPSFY